MINFQNVLGILYFSGHSGFFLIDNSNRRSAMYKTLYTVLVSFLTILVATGLTAAEYKGPNLSGQTVSIAGPWLTGDEENFDKVNAYFEKATGAKVDYAGSDSFEQQIVIDIKAGSPPNLAAFPQPGLAANMAAIGGLVPLGDDMENWVKNNYAAGPSWVDLGTYPDKSGNDQFYGFFYNVNVKSLVWYVPENFEAGGYEIPKTMEELIALSDQIVKDGGTPWCIGLGSGDATGWPATDWVEDIMLRTQTPDVYDGWVANTVKFNDPRVVNAIETFGKFAKNNDYVEGGSRAVGATDFRDSPKGMFTVPPKCYMHRQASFIPAFFPKGVEVGTDADFFYFPAFQAKAAQLGNPVLGGGTLMAITKDSPATREYMKYLQHPKSHEIWMSGKGFLTPHKGVNLNAYSSGILRKQGEILQNATTFRFDGSDLMPGAIGAGSFWSQMVFYVSGASAQKVADNIQNSWDAIK